MDLSYPAGKFDWSASISTEARPELISQLAAAPAGFREAVRGLDDSQLDAPYRPWGWTVRQVVHHLADSHMNSYIRFKLALTEDNPQIKPYDQDAWAATADSVSADIALSLTLLEGMHGRWAALLSSLAPADFARTFQHPESGLQTLDRTLQTYAWHCRHHVAHITGLRERSGWR